MEAQRSVATTVISSQPTVAARPETVFIQLQPGRHVSFDESAADNENEGKKKSKKCCIYHRKKNFDESSTESSDSDLDSPDTEPTQRQCTAARPSESTDFSEPSRKPTPSPHIGLGGRPTVPKDQAPLT